jgi:hypothetical protein
MGFKKRVAAIAFQMAVLASAGLLSFSEQARSYTDHPTHRAASVVEICPA